MATGRRPARMILEKAMSAEKVQRLNEFGRDRLPGLLGMEIISLTAERVTGRVTATPPLIAGSGFLWAPVVIALADTLCAYDAGENLPSGATSFTTAELKTNFLGTVGVGGAITGEATPHTAAAPRRSGTRWCATSRRARRSRCSAARRSSSTDA
jgi:acyl-coenzyme A thioesterase PaaI-like protein